MINMSHFGRRIAALRRTKAMTQQELADKLGVSPQAVSKWECGIALPEIELLLAMSHFYGVSVNEMIEGKNLLLDLTGREADEDGITYFIPKREMEYNTQWANEIIEGGWIKRNWNEAQENFQGDEIGKRIAETGGIILEIGAGPGGGFMPLILKANPNATVIINDLSMTVVSEWKKFLDRELNSPNLYYAVFDFCEMPFPDESIDCISDGGGILNCETGTKAQALKEAYRVLKPGGILVTSAGFVNRETLSRLPEKAQRELLKKRPEIFEDLYEDTVLAGFSKIDSVITGSWDTDDDDSALADLARSLGVNLRLTAYIRYCIK